MRVADARRTTGGSARRLDVSWSSGTGWRRDVAAGQSGFAGVEGFFPAATKKRQAHHVFLEYSFLLDSNAAFCRKSEARVYRWLHDLAQ